MKIEITTACMGSRNQKFEIPEDKKNKRERFITSNTVCVNSHKKTFNQQ